MRILDYIFYRIAKFYYKKDGRSAFRAIAIISFLEGALAVNLFLIVRIIFFKQSDFEKYIKYGSFIGVCIGIFLLVFNYFHFKEKYWKLSERWREEERVDLLLRSKRGWLVIVGIVSPFLLYVLLFVIF
jgi:hypothetical protein